MSAFSILVIALPVPSASRATPVILPVASMFQSELSMAIVSELSPMASAAPSAIIVSASI